MPYRHFSERLAAIYLEGFLRHELMAHNYWTAFGELDLISKDKGHLWHAVEVKWVRHRDYHPGAKMNRPKLIRMERALLHFFQHGCDADPDPNPNPKGKSSRNSKRSAVGAKKTRFSVIPSYTFDLMVFSLDHPAASSYHMEYFPNILL